MSGHDKSHDPNGAGHKSEDDIAYGKVILIGVVSLAIFAASTVWAAIILSHETKKYEEATGAVHRPQRITDEEIGIVDQVPFATDTRLHRWNAEHNKRLNGNGWVDKEKGVVHVPIERAMEAVAGGALPEGAPK